MRKNAALWLIAAMIIFAGFTRAATVTSVRITQTAQKDGTLYTFFDVNDETNSLVGGLEAQDISILAGSKELPSALSAFEDSGEGIALVFAVDISKSLTQRQFEQVREALQEWIVGMRDDDFAAVLTFGESIETITDFTNDRSRLGEIIKNLSPTDSLTKLYDGIHMAFNVALRQSDELPLRRCVVILSDGVDEFPAGATIAEVTKRAQSSGIPLYFVGIEDKNNKAQLNELGAIARFSGGDLYLAGKENLADGYTKIHSRIRGSYMASSVLDHTIANGSITPISLRVTLDGISVRHDADVRLEAIAPPPTPLPAPTPKSVTPSPSPRPQTPPPTPAPKPLITRETLFIIGGVLVAAAAALGIYLLIRYKKTKAMREEQEKIRAEKALGSAISAPTSAHWGNTDLGGDATEPLGGAGDPTALISDSDGRNLTLSLRERGSEERSFRAPLRARITVGRAADDNDIIISDKSISRVHCAFSFAGNALWLEDAGSSNGTFLFEKKALKQIHAGQRKEVKNGSVIRIGRVEFEINIQ